MADEVETEEKQETHVFGKPAPYVTGSLRPERPSGKTAIFPRGSDQDLQALKR